MDDPTSTKLEGRLPGRGAEVPGRPARRPGLHAAADGTHDRRHWRGPSAGCPSRSGGGQGGGRTRGAGSGQPGECRRRRPAGRQAVSSDLLTRSEALQLLLVLAGGFNLFIGMFNLVPLLPLDGGHIAGALYEAARRGVARLRRRPDPGYVDVAKMLPVAYVMASLFLVMGVVLILGDIVAPVHLLS
ncbi:MAG: site-2 protease family protein [Nocardioides sp.]